MNERLLRGRSRRAALVRDVTRPAPLRRERSPRRAAPSATRLHRRDVIAHTHTHAACTQRLAQAEPRDMRKFMRTAHTHAHAHAHAHADGGAARGEQLAAQARPGGGALYCDEQFPHGAGDMSSWRRPHELCARPRYRGDTRLVPPGGDDLAPDDLAPDDLATDDLATDDDDHSRWLLDSEGAACGVGAALCAAAGALAGAPRLLDRALPPHSFQHRYSGAFRFRFWVFGEWREVVVDDRLPTRAGRHLGATSASADDFTLPLLHKAYAKLHGGYAPLAAGRPSAARALQDLSGAIVQSFALRVQPAALTYQVLNSAVPRSTLLVATPAPEEARRARGALLPGQAYCVTGLARVRDAPGGGALVRLRAAGGAGRWAGAWAPQSERWRALAPHDRELLAARLVHPGDFWMAFEEFAQAFSSLELVHVGPDDWLREPALQARRPWRAVLARRRWRAGYNAGGPPGAPAADTNPQFHVQVARKVHVVVSVTQQYEPAARRHGAIGFSVCEAREGGGGALWVRHESRAREVATFFTLPAGRYAVVPYTGRAHSEACFLLRLLTDEPADVWELNEDNLVLRDMHLELQSDDHLVPDEVRAAVARLMRDCDAAEVEAGALRELLRRVWRAVLCRAPSLELCHALVSLRDASLAGCVARGELPALLALLGYWRALFLRAAPRRCGAPRVSSYRLRALLSAAGLSASNKVLECVVVRYARRRALSHEHYVMALARILVAHERYRRLDNKLKANPLSLEEMILMTLYS